MVVSGRISSIELIQLGYFLEVARAGSFRQAALALDVPAAALAAQIRLLEAELGAALLIRTCGNRPVQLTAAGAALVPRATAVLHAVDHGLATVLPFRGQKTVPG
jgi:DNA-binding transcriptional LysR family regulator